jgi:VanZ family protein
MPRKRWRAFVPAIVWTALVLVLLSIPGSAIPSEALWSYDKVGHVFLFFGLAFFWLRAVTADNTRLILLILLAGLVFAPLTELYQGLVALDRTPDVMDSVADGVGFILGTGAWILIDRFRRRKNDLGRPEERA